METYTYDSQNRLIGYTDGAGVTSTYAFDAMDRRVAKTVDGVTTAYVYDADADRSLDMNDILMEFDATNAANKTLTRRWAHSDRTDEPVAYENYIATGPPGSGSVRGVYTDRMGSIVMIVDPVTSAIKAQYEYDAFGNRTAVVATESQSYGFTGREFDAESNLHYFRARHLDTGLGQFVQRDPIGFASGHANLYAYVQQLYRSDPD